MKDRQLQPRQIFLWLSLLVHRAGGAQEPYYVKLPNIQSTVGVWNPPFDPNVTVYTIKVSPTTRTATFEFDVDYSRYANDDPPLMAANNTRLTYTESQPATYTVDLGESFYGASVNLTVIVAGPPDEIANPDVFQQTLYQLHIQRDPDPDKTLAISGLIVDDDHQREIALRPAFATNSLARSYDASVAPDVARIRVTPTCDAKATAEVNGESVRTNSFAWVALNEDASHTTVRVGCRYGTEHRDFIINVRESLNLDDAVSNLQLRVLGDEGMVERTGNYSFVIKSSADEIEFVPIDGDSHLTMLLEVAEGKHYPLGIGVPSPALKMPRNGTAVYKIRVRFGDDTRDIEVLLDWFATTTLPPQGKPTQLFQTMGRVTLGLSLCLLGISVLAIAMATVRGLGSVRNRSIAVVFRSLTFVLQFLSLVNVLRGPCAWSDFAAPLLWLSLVFPDESHADGGFGFSISLEKAAAVLLYSYAILGVVASMHVVLLVAGGPLRCWHFTIPHQSRSPAWEVHCMLHLLFPASCSSMLILMSETSALNDVHVQFPLTSSFLPASFWQAGAIVFLVMPIGVALLSAYCVHKAVATGRAVWVTMGTDEDGSYCDAVCDQLNTRIVERSACGSLFPSLCWATTVADIRPTKISMSDVHTCTEEEDYILVGKEDEDLGVVEADDVTPRAALWVSGADRVVDVDVISTVKLVAAHSEASCAEVGMFANVSWLRALLSVESLLRLHQDVDHQLHDSATPLSVRAEQLQGPLTSGHLSFCFTGFRWPQWTPLEVLLRVILGVFTGIAVTYPQFLALPFVFMALLTTLCVTMLLHEPPYTTFVENASVLIAHLAVALIAFSYLAYSLGVFSLSISSGVLLLLAACAVPPLLVHMALVAIALVSVVLCPAGNAEEADGLQRCNVDLALRGPNGSWLLLVPAECSVPVTDAFVHALPAGHGDARVYSHFGNLIKGSKPRLEFPVLDYLHPAEKLEPPLVVMFGSSREPDSDIGAYRSECVYADEDPWTMALEFAKRGPRASVEYAPEVAREILELVRNHARIGEILVVGIVPVPRIDVPRREDFSDGSEGEELEALIASARSWR